MIVNLFWRRDLSRASEALSHLPPAERDDPRFALLDAVRLKEEGRLAEAMRRLGGLDATALHREAFWAARWLDLVLWSLQEADGVLGALLAGLNPVSANERRLPVLAAAAMPALLHADSPAMMSARIRALLGARVGQPAEVFCEAVLSLPLHGALEAKAHGLAAFLSFRFDAHLQRFADRFLPDPELERHPYLLEFAVAHPHISAHSGLAHLGGPLPSEVREAMEATVREGRSPYMHQARKLLARDAALGERSAPPGLHALPITLPPAARGRGQPLHVFVGVFGQLRYPEVALPRLQRRLEADLVQLGATISYGLSTWTQQGRRHLSDLDPAGLALARLPESLARPLSLLSHASVSELARDLPALVAALRAEPTQGLAISHERLRRDIGWSGRTALETEAAFQEVDGAALEARFGANVPILNQGRMWSRLAALGPLSDEAAADVGRGVDAYLFIRADLHVLSGDFSPAISRLLASPNDRDLVVDHDGWAAFIEGMGDRYVICRPDSAARLFDGRRVLLDVIGSGGSISPDYLREMEGHTFLSTLMFENGGSAIQLFRDELDFEIDRGRLSGRDLALALRSDLQTSPSEAVRGLLASFLADGAPASASDTS